MKGVIWGVVGTCVLIITYLVGVGNGRATIIYACEVHKAFTYAEEAWVCSRLKKGVKDITDIKSNQGVST